MQRKYQRKMSYHDVPHIHLKEDAIRENKTTITWEDVEKYLTAFLKEETK